MVLKVLGSGCLGLGLRVVQATRTLCPLSFVRPLAVWPLRDVPSLSWHQSSKRSNVCTWQKIPAPPAELREGDATQVVFAIAIPVRPVADPRRLSRSP